MKEEECLDYLLPQVGPIVSSVKVSKLMQDELIELFFVQPLSKSKRKDDRRLGEARCHRTADALRASESYRSAKPGARQPLVQTFLTRWTQRGTRLLELS